MSEQIKVLTTLEMPSTTGTLCISVKAEKPIFILGRNGTGKSALVHRLSVILGNRVIYMPGSRPSYFDSESLSLNPSTRKNLESNLKGWDNSPDTRWRSISGTQRNEKAIHDLQSGETQFKIDAANEIKLHGSSSAAISRLQSDASPLDRVNSLLAQANLSVQLTIKGGELRAQQNGATYSYARMSDGERSALIFAAEVVAAPSQAIFLIDEPELHLHPAIVVPLLTSFIHERPDCGFIICTHELELPIACPGEILLVRKGNWAGDQVSSWDLDLIENSDEIPEEIRRDLIGARRKILFIEGSDDSMDKPLYSLLFPKVSLRTKESCKEVMKAVGGLRSTQSLHRSEAYGLIDHDGMSEARKSDLEAEGIYPLPIFAVESLYYSDEVLTAVAVRQVNNLGGSVDNLLDEAKRAAFVALDAERIKNLASRIAERKMRDQLMHEIPSREKIMSGEALNIEISFPSPYAKEVDLLTNLVHVKDLSGIVSRYPVRESGVLNNIAKGLRFTGRVDYERAVLQAVKTDSNLRNMIKSRLGNLAIHLE